MWSNALKTLFYLVYVQSAIPPEIATLSTGKAVDSDLQLQMAVVFPL
jgi:hypothetical protein